MRVLQTFLSAGWLRLVQLAGPSAHRYAAALQFDWQRVRVMHGCVCVCVRGVCWVGLGGVHRQLLDQCGCLLPCFAGASGVPSQPGCTEIDCTGTVAPMQEFFAGWCVRAVRGFVAGIQAKYLLDTRHCTRASPSVCVLHGGLLRYLLVPISA